MLTCHRLWSMWNMCQLGLGGSNYGMVDFETFKAPVAGPGCAVTQCWRDAVDSSPGPGFWGLCSNWCLGIHGIQWKRDVHRMRWNVTECDVFAFRQLECEPRNLTAMWVQMKITCVYSIVLESGTELRNIMDILSEFPPKFSYIQTYSIYNFWTPISRAPNFPKLISFS